MTYINTRASGVAGNVTGTVVGSKRALDVNVADVDDLRFTIDNSDTHTFASAITTPATSSYTVAGMKTMVLDISGTSVTPVTYWYGAGASTTPHAVNCVNLNTLAVTTSSSNTSELWSCDITGLTTFSVTTTPQGGNVTITGKAVG